MDVGFMFMFFASKKLYMMTAFLCWPPEELLKLWRSGERWGVRLSVHTQAQRLPALAAYHVHREGVLLDVSCPHAAMVLDKASSNRAFIHRYTWMLLDNSTYDVTTVRATLADTIILPDADVTWASANRLVDVYRVKNGEPLLVTPLDLTWNSTAEELATLWASLPTAVTRRKDLHDVHITGATVVGQPQYFKGWSDLSSRQLDIFPKFTHPLIMLCAEDMHFRLNLRQVDLYGVERNGSFSGLCGLLQRNVVEIGLVSQFMRSDRSRVLHYCAETVQLVGAFIFRQPAQSAVSNVFLLPFSGGVWRALAALLLAAALLLPLDPAPTAAPAAPAAPAAAPSRPHRLTLPDAFTFAIGAICQQGFYITPRATSIRLAMFFTLSASVFLFTAYSAKIVTLLQTASDAIRSIEDLTRSPFAVAVQDTTYKEVYFAESKEPATRELYRRKLKPLGARAYLSVREGKARVRDGLFAFQVEVSAGYDEILQTFTEHEKCSLQEVQAFRLPPVGVPLRWHSGYRDLFAARLRWQREAGHTARWRARWLARRPPCAARAAGFAGVRLLDVLPALQVVGAGALAAVLLLCAEIGAHALLRDTTRRRVRCFICLVYDLRVLHAVTRLSVLSFDTFNDKINK